jgi:hypothetical protein
VTFHSVRGGGHRKHEPRPVDGCVDTVAGGEHLHPVASVVHDGGDNHLEIGCGDGGG